MFREGLDPDVVRQSVMKNHPGLPKVAVVEKKSLKSLERKTLEGILGELGLDVVYV